MRAFLLTLLFPSLAFADWPPKLRTVEPEAAAAEIKATPGPRLVVLWAAWCGDCRREMPDLDALAPIWAPRGLRILAYDIDETPEPLSRYLAARPLSLPFARLTTSDKSALQKMTAQLGGNYTGGIPYLALLDKSGKLVAEWTRGKPVDRAELEAAFAKVTGR
jgi:thiol-disulfide isomerase/thioredoxin